jgi:glycosyltransferase involved in cell wall biosynthesis
VITVGIPTYNRRESVSRVVGSLQPLAEAGEIDLVVVDDGSSDGTCDALAGMTRVVNHERNLGYPAAFIRLFEECRTDYLLITADDDWVDVAALAELDRFLQSETPDFVSTQWTFGDGTLFRGRHHAGAIKPREFRSAANHAPGLVYRVAACRLALDFLRERLVESSEIARVYPQIVVLTTLLACGYNCRWWHRVVVSEGDGHPSGIRGADGRPYQEAHSRLVQHASLTSHLRQLPVGVAADVRSELLREHGHSLYWTVRGYVDDLESGLSNHLDASARRYLLRAVPRKVMAKLRSQEPDAPS